jgi:hypothetical protein
MRRVGVKENGCFVADRRVMVSLSQTLIKIGASPCALAPFEMFYPEGPEREETVRRFLDILVNLSCILGYSVSGHLGESDLGLCFWQSTAVLESN